VAAREEAEARLAAVAARAVRLDEDATRAHAAHNTTVTTLLEPN
jgi:hypothetical protein